MEKIVTTIQEVLFDLYDLMETNDDQPIDGFEEFKTLYDFLGDQINKLASVETQLKQGAN